MLCYRHREVSAIGTCMACGRGLCDECAASVRESLACRGNCEQRLLKVLQLRDWSMQQPHLQQQMLARATGAQRIGALFMLMLAVFAAVIAVVYGAEPLSFLALSLAMGAVMLFMMSRRIGRLDSLRACPECGYNLTGSRSNVCPECGRRGV